jgi:hypothetical protein
MKRIQALIALALCLALTLGAYLTVQAQRGDGALLGAYEPDSAASTAVPSVPEGTSLTEKRMALDNQLDGQPVRTELTFALTVKPQDAAWSELTDRFAAEVLEQIARVPQNRGRALQRHPCAYPRDRRLRRTLAAEKST